MYCQSFFVISVRGIGFAPTTAPNGPSGCFGALNAAFGVRFGLLFFAAFFAGRFAPALFFFAPPFFAPPFFAAFFPPFFAAILSPGRWNGWGFHSEERCFPSENARASRAKSIVIGGGRNRKERFPPLGNRV